MTDITGDARQERLTPTGIKAKQKYDVHVHMIDWSSVDCMMCHFSNESPFVPQLTHNLNKYTNIILVTLMNNIDRYSSYCVLPVAFRNGMNSEYVQSKMAHQFS